MKSSVASPVANQINLQALAADMIANPREDFAFPILQIKNLYGEANPLFNGFVNYYLGDNQLENEPTLSEEEEWQHAYIPQLLVRYILNLIADAVGLSNYSGEWWTDADMQQVLIQLQPLQIENVTQRIELPFRPLHQSIGAPHPSDQLIESSILRFASSQLSGGSDELGVGVESPAVRFFFDRGIQPDTQDRLYNLAIHGTQNIKGEAVGEQSLDLKDDNELYENYFKGYIQLQDNKTVTKRFRLGMAQLLELRKWENARISVEQAEGSFEGIVKQVRFQVTTRRMLIAEVELVSTL